MADISELFENNRTEVWSPGVPAWVTACFSETPMQVASVGPVQILWVEAEEHLFVRSRVLRGAPLDPGEVGSCYAAAVDMATSRGLHPVRFWNYVPGITRGHREGRCGYEVFNAARFSFFRRWQQDCDLRSWLMPATAVDPGAEVFTLDLFAAAARGTPVDNGRQIPAFDYSKRYGPVPPAFSRAIRLDAPEHQGLPHTIVAGTASIVGEDSVHAGDLLSQLAETGRNLAAVASASRGERSDSEEARRCALGRYESLRVYLRRVEDVDPLLQWVDETFPASPVCEILRADLCRPDLLVEIEGVVGCAG
jgi:enamine deaminase RidA (YjgF/YER057c/UK114 family)